MRRLLTTTTTLLAGCLGMPIRGGEPAQPAPPRGVLGFRWRQVLTGQGYEGERAEEFASPEVDRHGGRLFVGSASGVVRALELGRGEQKWRFRARGAVSGRPLYVARLGVVFVGSDDGNLYALSADRGEPRWSYATRGTVRRRPAYLDGVVYFATSDDRIYAVEARTGRWRWHYQRERPDGFTIHGEAGVAVAQGRVYGAFSDGHAVALDARTGDVLWSRPLGDRDGPGGLDGAYPDADGTPWIDAERGAVYASSFRGGVWSLDAEDGTVRWRQPIEGAGALRLAGDRLYLSSPVEGVLALETARGEIVWRQAVAQGSPGTPVPGEDHVFVATSEGGLLALDRRTGRPAAFFPTGGGVSAEPVIADGSIYFLSNQGSLYAAALGGGS